MSSRNRSGSSAVNQEADIEKIFAVQDTARTPAELEALAREALKDANPVVRRLAFARLLESMTSENAKDIRVHLVEMGAGRQEWHDFHYSWGAMAGGPAMANAMETDEPDMEHTLTGWASANPSEALAWLKNLPQDQRRNLDDLERSIVAGTADADTALATNLVFQMANEGNERAGRYIHTVAGEVLRSMGAENATQWAEALPDGNLKGAAMDQVAGALVNRDPEAAAAWAERFAGESYAGRVIEEVGDEWAERNPQKAVAWLQTLPANDGQRSGLRSAFDEWTERDPVGAGEYLMTMRPSAQRDAAISGFVGEYARRDPETAIAWAEDIGDPQARVAALTRAGQSYVRRNADAAKNWLAQSGLPAETQQQILNPPRRRR